MTTKQSNKWMINALVCVIFAGAITMPTAVLALTGTWNKATSGDFAWTNTANWTPSTAYPNGTGDVAIVSLTLSGSQTNTLNVPITLSKLTYGGLGSTAYSMEIAAGTGGSLTFASTNGNAKLIVDSANISAAQSDLISSPVVLASDLDVLLQVMGGSRKLIFTGDISETGGSRNINLANRYFVYKGSNSYSGRTTLDMTYLDLDYRPNNASKLSPTSELRMSHSYLTVTGNTAQATSQTVGGLVLSNGVSTATLVASTNQNLTFNLGAISRTGLGSIKFAKANNGSGIASFTTTSANSNGILGGYATFGNDWAINNGGIITNLTVYGTDLFANNTNTYVNSSQTASSNFTINSLKLTGKVAPTYTLTLQGDNNVIQSGGILNVTYGMIITNGSFTSGNGRDIIINNYGGLNIKSAITDNGSTPIGLTINGSTALTLGGRNTFSGDIVNGASSLKVTSEGGLGVNNTIWLMIASAYLNFETPSSAVFSNNIVWKTAVYGNNTLNNNGSNTTVTLAGKLILDPSARSNLSVGGVENSALNLLGDNSGMTSGLSLGSTLGTLRLGHSKAFSTMTIKLNTTNYLQSVYVLDQIAVGNAVEINSITNGAPVQVGMDSPGMGSFSGIITLGNAINPPDERKVYFVATNGAAVTFSELIQGSTGRILPLNVTGGGTVLLSRALGNTYPGPTVVSNATLWVNNTSSSGTGTNTVSVSSGGTLGGIGLITGVVSVASGCTLAPGTNSVGTLTVGGLTLASGSTYAVQVGGTNTVSYDRCVVTKGTVDVTDSRVSLSCTGGYIPNVRDTFTIIRNMTGTTVTGRFTDDANIKASGIPGTFEVSYNVGANKDVVLRYAGIKGTMIRVM